MSKAKAVKVVKSKAVKVTKTVNPNVAALKAKREALKVKRAEVKALLAEVKTLTEKGKADREKAKADRAVMKEARALAAKERKEKAIAKAKAKLEALLNPAGKAARNLAKKPGPVTVVKPELAAA